jgi:hypothetical protein
MQPIPTPHVLDPDRILVNDRGGFTASHERREDALETALKETCEYAQQLWQNLDGARAYLMKSLPVDPRAPGPHPTASASPTGPDDEQGWENWITAYASVTSVLAGPHGDSGFGLGEARRAARDRRTAPILTLAADHPELGTTPPEPDPPARADAEPARPTSVAKVAGLAVAGLLVLRGLRPHRPRSW